MAFAGVALLGVVQGGAALVIVALVWGMGTGTNWMLAHTELQRRADDETIGRLAAFDELMVTAAMVGSALVAAALVEPYGIGAALGAGVGLGGAGYALVDRMTRQSRSRLLPTAAAGEGPAARG